MNNLSMLWVAISNGFLWFSMGVAVLASYLALSFANHTKPDTGGHRGALFVGILLSLACALWMGHLLAFLVLSPMAVQLQSTDAAASVFSLLLALLSGYTFSWFSGRDGAGQIALGSLLAGGEILGMDAVLVRLPWRMGQYRMEHGVHLLLATLVSFTVLYLMARVRQRVKNSVTILVIAILLGLAYTCDSLFAMIDWSTAHPPAAGAVWSPIACPPVVWHAVGISLVALSILVGLVLRLNHAFVTQNHYLMAEYGMHRALLDSIPEFMYIKDNQHRFLVVNASLARSVGVDSPEKMLGKTDEHYFPQELAHLYMEQERAILRSGQGSYHHEEPCVNREGEPIQILTTKVPIKNAQGQLIGIAGIGRDITTTKKMESTLREAELKYRGIFNKAIVGIFQCTPDGRFLSVNPSMAFSFGYASPEEMVTSITDLGTQFFADPARGQEFMMMMQKVGGVKNFECEAFCQDGKTIWLTMSTRTIREKGKIIRIEGVCDDISERMQMREQVLHTQKLEAVGQLAAGIAHEINTPTQFIGDNVRFIKDNFAEIEAVLKSYHALYQAARMHEILASHLSATEQAIKEAELDYLLEEIPKALDQSLDGVGRVASIVGAMKEFSHPGTEGKVPIDLNHAIESAMVVCRNEWKYVARMETSLDPNLPNIDCIPSELGQVILNLIVNAAHAIADSAAQGGPAMGTIHIVTRNGVEWVEISIGDTGTGIPLAIQNRVFDPFFTTKEIGKGTGQGLSIARSVIVDKHQGTIHFETKSGEGTTFIIRLPHSGKVLARNGAT